MKSLHGLMRVLVGLLAAATTAAAQNANPGPAVYFDWFEYSGHDAVFEKPAPEGTYRNPILAGFYPDPSVTQVNGVFYVVNSTFGYFPGIPVFESHDLVHWRQVGHVIDRPGELDFDGLGTSRGVFAPAISLHDGVFYVVNTSVDAGGNFLAVARNPAGPWSDPIWLPGIDGIDPSLFFGLALRPLALSRDASSISRSTPVPSWRFRLWRASQPGSPHFRMRTIGTFSASSATLTPRSRYSLNGAPVHIPRRLCTPPWRKGRRTS